MKPAEAFGRQAKSPDGLRPTCKVCRARQYQASLPPDRKRQVSASVLRKLGEAPAVPPIEESADGQIMRVPLTHGAFATIDAADWPLIAPHVWHLGASGYAVTNGIRRGRRGLIYMHVLIAGTDDAPEVDHKSRDRLDNRRGNLRPANRQQQRMNEGKREGGTSRFKGVNFHRLSGKWRAAIQVDGQQHYLGLFDTEEAAAHAYDAECLRLHGEFAVPNGV